MWGVEEDFNKLAGLGCSKAACAVGQMRLDWILDNLHRIPCRGGWVGGKVLGEALRRSQGSPAKRSSELNAVISELNAVQ